MVFEKCNAVRGRTRGFGEKQQREIVIEKVGEERTKTAKKRINLLMEESNKEMFEMMNWQWK